jgi:hypothetical protein
MKDVIKSLICDSIELTNIDRSRLFELISSVSDNMSAEKIAEIAYYIQGKIDADELPETIENVDYPNAKLISYNFCKDVVKFQHDRANVRFFETKESALEFSKSGRGYGYSSSDERHPFEGVHTSTHCSEMSKERWLNNGSYC